MMFSRVVNRPSTICRLLSQFPGHRGLSGSGGRQGKEIEWQEERSALMTKLHFSVWRTAGRVAGNNYRRLRQY